ncbi:MAG: hypothetical protein ACJAQ2_002046 [Vicingaceae bacterium]|jgi:hypothetical protein
MRTFKLILFIFLFSACYYSDNSNAEVKLDTLTIKIGAQHLEPTPTSQMVITFKSLAGERITRFYSDSTYELTVEHNFGVKLTLYERTENFDLQPSDSTYLLTTSLLDSGRTDKLQVGFLTDTTANVLMYHYRLQDQNDSTEVLNFKKQIDTVGYSEFKLYGRKSR